MAQFKNDFFKFLGVIGNLQFMEVEGQQIVKSVPSHRNVKSPKVLKNMSVFGFIQNLYSGICHNPWMYKIWRKKFTKRRALNTFFAQVNKPVVLSQNDVDKVIMSPLDDFFTLPECQLQRENGVFSLKISPLDTSIGFNKYKEHFIGAAGFYYQGEREDNSNDRRINTISSNLAEIVYGEEITLSLKAGQKIFTINDLEKDYRRTEVYIVLVTFSEGDDPVRTSLKKQFTIQDVTV